MRGRASADGCSRCNFTRGLQTDQPVAFVIVSLASRRSWLKRQHRSDSTENLNLGLFISTENNSVGRRIHVETDDIVDLLFGFGTLRGISSV